MFGIVLYSIEKVYKNNKLIEYSFRIYATCCYNNACFASYAKVSVFGLLFEYHFVLEW